MKVTCIMPTADRLDFVALAIKYFHQQTWPYLELVIVDSGKRIITESAEIVHAIRHDTRIRWTRGHVGMLIGDARNMACDMASGEAICHWDDDDWYAPCRVTEQATELLRCDSPIVGSPSLAFVKDAQRKAWRYCYPGAHYGVGVSLMYLKEAWKDSAGFRHCKDADGAWPWGEDTNWLAEMRSRGGVHQAHTKSIVARIHGSNTGGYTDEKLNGDNWSPMDWSEIEAMGYERAA